MEMRKCKECGELFQPKGREQYCPKQHYRPCPVCGTPVLAKYLSDPPRRCDMCKKSHRNITEKKQSRISSIIQSNIKNESTSTQLNSNSSIKEESKKQVKYIEPNVYPNCHVADLVGAIIRNIYTGIEYTVSAQSEDLSTVSVSTNGSNITMASSDCVVVSLPN